MIPVPQSDAMRLASWEIGVPETVPMLEHALDLETDELALVGLFYALYRLGQHNRLKAFLNLLDSDDFLIRENVFNIVDVDYIRPEDREELKSAVVQLLEHEIHPAVRASAVKVKVGNRE